MASDPEATQSGLPDEQEDDRAEQGDAQEQLHKHPLLTYISPGRFATIDKTQAYPFPKGFSR